MYEIFVVYISEFQTTPPAQSNIVYDQFGNRKVYIVCIDVNIYKKE